MPTLYNFNDAGGTSDQQQCQGTGADDSCGIYDKATGNYRRKNADGEFVDIKYWLYESDGDTYAILEDCIDKCGNCPYWAQFKIDKGYL